MSTRIIARSRIGFWTAFSTDEGSFLNMRDMDGSTITVVIDARDGTLLASDAATCHDHAAHLREHGRRLATPVPTPPRGDNEPEAHEWQPRTETRELRKAA